MYLQISDKAKMAIIENSSCNSRFEIFSTILIIVVLIASVILFLDWFKKRTEQNKIK